jgi:hypothetical protein
MSNLTEGKPINELSVMAVIPSPPDDDLAATGAGAGVVLTAAYEATDKARASSKVKENIFFIFFTPFVIKKNLCWLLLYRGYDHLATEIYEVKKNDRPDEN